MRRFLLGDMAEEERARLEEQVLATDELYEQLLTVEDDLIDAYARGELSDGERRSFEQQLGSSPLLRNRIELAGSLDSWLSAHAAAEARGRAVSGSAPGSSTTEPGQVRLFSTRRYFSLSYAAAASVLFLLVTCLVIRNVGLSHDEAGSNRGLEQRRAVEQQDRGQQRDGDTELLVVLSPSLRGSGDPVVLTPDIETVRFQIDLREATGFSSYQAHLLSAKEEEIWRGQGLVERRNSWCSYVEAKVPAAALESGDFQLVLEGITPGAPPQQLSSFDFSVVESIETFP